MAEARHFFATELGRPTLIVMVSQSAVYLVTGRAKTLQFPQGSGSDAKAGKGTFQGLDFCNRHMDNSVVEIRLGELEAAVLYSVYHCGDDAYGVAIADTIKHRTGDDVAPGAIYATLDRLEKKDLVRSWWSDPRTARGGRRKRLYEITGGGKRALADYDKRFMSIRRGWCPVPGMEGA